ncbi:MAG: hypothetical protein FWE50_03905 [Alphaproteobacteria bacterium]|nr:hypothetical protein [Alphaproteobacteria bacterium]
MPKKPIINNSKAAGFVAAKQTTEIKTVQDRPCWLVRALRWVFITAPRAVWNWICSIEIGGLCNLTMLLLIIVLFSILIGQVLNMRCYRKVLVRTPEIINVTSPVAKTIDNVQITEESAPKKKTTIVLPLEQNEKANAEVIPAAPAKVAEPTFIKVNGDLIVDGEQIGRGLNSMTKINGNLYLQNMRYFTLPCGVKINGNLIVRNVRQLKFCGHFVVNGDIYVSADSSFGPIPRNAKVRGQVIF